MESSRNFFDDDNNIKLKLSDFQFELPQQLVAQYPLENREESRMMVLNRQRIITHVMHEHQYYFLGTLMLAFTVK